MSSGSATCPILLGFALSFAQPSPAQTGTAAEAQASAHLALAEAYLQSQDPAKAEEQVLKAIEAAPGLTGRREGGIRLLAEALAQKRQKEQARQRSTERRNLALLTEAERLLAEGRLDEAVKLTTETLGTLEDPKALSAAEQSLKAAHPGWWRAKWAQHVKRGWIGDAVLILLALLALLLVLRVLRRLFALMHRRSWLVAAIDDKTGLGFADLVLAGLHRWRVEETPTSGGLLRLGTLQLQTVPQFRQEAPKVDFASAVAALPQVGGVAPAALMKLLEVLPSWFNSGRPAIAGSAAIFDGQVIVRLTCKSRVGKIQTVSAIAAKEAASCAVVAYEVSFKMYYLIANDSTVAEADAADRMRLGLQHLKSYLLTGQASALDDAREVFASVHAQQPTFDEALLYEGIALDLQEKHEDAEARFQHLANTARGELRDKARYNQAISKFRRYRPEQLEESIKVLDKLIGDAGLKGLENSLRLKRLASSPIKTLSLAAKANAIAHRPIFWQGLLFGGKREKDPDEVLKRKNAKRSEIEAWVSEVEQITDELSQVYDLVSAEVREQEARRPGSGRSWWDRYRRRLFGRRSAEKWDPMTIRQLQWAIENARGNVYLNSANNFYVEPYLPGAGEPDLRKSYLEKAQVAFQHSEMLLPPGVETLTNLATTCLSLEKASRAREYLQRAIKLNKTYEYAYYRLAQAWDNDKKLPESERALEAKKVMESLPFPPTIGGFKEMFERHGVVPRAT